MAFKTRTGRTAAIGRITMNLSVVLWWIVLVELILITLALSAGAWSGWLSTGSPIKGDFRVASETAAELANLVLITHLPEFGMAIAVFAGPKNRLRDQAAAAMQSRTGRWFMLSSALTIALLVTLRAAPSAGQAFLAAALLVSLVCVWWVVLRGVRSIARSDDAAPYFEGMSEQEKVLADSPWPSRPIKGFLDLDLLVTSADADRYAHRAADIARMHDWLGGGLFVVSTAFLGAAVAQLFEAGSTSPLVWAGLSLLGAAGGYAVQRRGRVYHRMQEEYERAGAELDRAQRVAPLARHPQFWSKVRALFGR